VAHLLSTAHCPDHTSGEEVALQWWWEIANRTRLRDTGFLDTLVRYATLRHRRRVAALVSESFSLGCDTVGWVWTTSGRRHETSTYCCRTISRKTWSTRRSSAPHGHEACDTTRL
jgi:hypothetical protein